VEKVAQTMYIHVSKCKNSKIKGKKEPQKILFYGTWRLK
jgi:hypothetical protein